MDEKLYIGKKFKLKCYFILPLQMNVLFMIYKNLNYACFFFVGR